MKLTEIKPNDRNPRTITKDKLEKLKKSIKDFDKMMSLRPIVVDENNVILGGNMRYNALKALGYKDIPDEWVKKAENLTEEEKRRFIIEDNVGFGEWDWDMLANEWEVSDLQEWGLDLPNFEVEEEATAEEVSKLSDRFIVPPFDVLDGRKAEWIKRKGIWEKVIGDKGQSRTKAKSYNNKSFNNKYKFNAELHETSLLDPVLSEIVICWFGVENGLCFDCFAGDTAFGAVASHLGNKFVGVELRKEQVDFNNEHTNENAIYHCDDGRNIQKYLANESADLLFSCPPYFNLEVYSDMENDASNQETYEDFYNILDEAFANSIKCLKNDRFAVIVVGDVRNKKNGGYYNFPNDIIKTFISQGLLFYSNIKLLTPIGNAHIRANNNMGKRKPVHVYQDVLVFYKGDTKNIPKNFKPINYDSKYLESLAMD